MIPWPVVGLGLQVMLAPAECRAGFQLVANRWREHSRSSHGWTARQPLLARCGFLANSRSADAHILTMPRSKGVPKLIASPLADTVGWLRGIVVDSAGQPLAHAEVRIAETGTTVLTGDDGAFAMQMHADRAYTLEVRAVGYRSSRTIVRAAAVTSAELRIELHRLTQHLNAVRVEGRLAGSAELASFERRWLRSVGGVFVTGAELRLRPGFEVSDAMRGVPGLRVLPAANGRQRLEATGMGGRRCAPVVFLDGVPLSGKSVQAPHLLIDEVIYREEVAAIEIYSRSAMVPAHFVDFADCGAVAVWTLRHFGGRIPVAPEKERRDDGYVP